MNDQRWFARLFFKSMLIHSKQSPVPQSPIHCWTTSVGRAQDQLTLTVKAKYKASDVVKQILGRNTVQLKKMVIQGGKLLEPNPNWN